MYGARSHAAGLEIFLKTSMVKTIAAHKSTIIARALPMECVPKNTGDQTALSASWAANSHIEIPIKRYNSAHTGPKSHPGGLSAGFTSPSYQVGISETVKNDPAIPASPATATEMMSLKKLLIRTHLFYH